MSFGTISRRELINDDVSRGIIPPEEKRLFPRQEPDARGPPKTEITRPLEQRFIGYGPAEGFVLVAGPVRYLVGLDRLVHLEAPEPVRWDGVIVICTAEPGICNGGRLCLVRDDVNLGYAVEELPQWSAGFVSMLGAGDLPCRCIQERRSWREVTRQTWCRVSRVTRLCLW